MTSDSIDWDEDLPADPEEEYQTFVRTLERTEGFRLLFVRCTPREGERLIVRVKKDLPQKNIEVLRLDKAIDNLYELVKHLLNREQINILFIQGLEYSFYEYEEKKFGESTERYFYSWKGVPQILNHLNQQRERFRDDFNICFVFILRSFSLKYFIRRAPDFFDWGSGVFDFDTDTDIKVLPRELDNCLELTPEELSIKLLEVQSLLEENQQDLEQKADLFFKQGLLLLRTERDEEAIISFDKVIAFKPDDYNAWRKRGIALYNLGRYQESHSSASKALEIESKEDSALEIESKEDSANEQDSANRMLHLQNLPEFSPLAEKSASGMVQTVATRIAKESNIDSLSLLLYNELQTQVKSGIEMVQAVVNRIVGEVERICRHSDRIQTSGEVHSWQLTLARHRLQKCLSYYKLGSKQGRVELYGNLSAMVYRHLALSESRLSVSARYNLIEDFLQDFYAESLKAFRRENSVDANYTPRTQLELAEYMAFTEQYAKRRIRILSPDGNNQQLIVLRAQSFARRQPLDVLTVDLEDYYLDRQIAIEAEAELEN